MCGPPTSGKTRKAKAIISYFSKNHPEIETILLNEELFEINKEESYSDEAKEKFLRGFFRSNVNKNLTDKNLVILDSLNYIKGFRYELYCICRIMKTRHCVVLCDTDIYTVKEFNQKCGHYSDKLLEDLFNRMERPNEKNRWDKPLFSVFPEDELNFEEIYSQLFENTQDMKKSRTTQCDNKLGNNYSSKVDKTIQVIIEDIVEKVNENKKFLNNKYVICKIGKEDVNIKNDVTIHNLKKWKNEFISMNKLNPFKTIEAVQEAFVYYLKSKM